MWRAGLSRVGLARFVRPQTNVCSNAQVRDHVLLAVFGRALVLLERVISKPILMIASTISDALPIMLEPYIRRRLCRLADTMRSGASPRIYKEDVVRCSVRQRWNSIINTTTRTA